MKLSDGVTSMDFTKDDSIALFSQLDETIQLSYCFFPLFFCLWFLNWFFLRVVNFRMLNGILEWLWRRIVSGFTMQSFRPIIIVKNDSWWGDEREWGWEWVVVGASCMDACLRIWDFPSNKLRTEIPCDPSISLYIHFLFLLFLIVYH